ncbi:MAG: hypothetical protein KF829_04010 [Ferruginibacter sp.]|nr:hypothetical protein [Ferruginibacter sp.]
MVAIANGFTFHNVMKKKPYHISVSILVGHLILILCLTPKISNGQQLFKITYGDLDTDRVSLTSFKLQKELVIHNGFKLDTALMCFQIPGESGIFVVDYKPILDTIKFNKCIDLLKPGSYVSFENIIISDSSNNKFTPHNRIHYLITPDIVNTHKNSESFIEIKRLQNLNYVSGTIYFSGTYFPNVQVCRVYKNKSSFLTNAFERCAIGTKITLENVYYLDDDKKLVGPLNKTVTLD